MPDQLHFDNTAKAVNRTVSGFQLKGWMIVAALAVAVVAGAFIAGIF